MKAEIIAIGTELLLGEITDTNTPFIAQQLAALGIDLYYTSTVGDNYERLVGVLRMAWGRSDIILTTGGLGPSQGDVTRFTIAGLLGEKPYIDPGLKQDLVKMFEKRGLELTPNNIKQATLIPSATAILNPRGTAPGWWVEKDRRIIVALPGPPGELQTMWHSGVLSGLKAKSEAVILSRTLKTSGLSESKIDDLLAPFSSSSNPTLATYAKADGIHVRITAKAGVPQDAEKMIADREAEVKGVLGSSIWGADSETLESTIGKLLAAKGLTLGVVDAFWDGTLIRNLTNEPASSTFFRGGIVTRSGEAGIALGISPEIIAGNDVPRIAAEMAQIARSKFKADIGIALYGESPADNSSICRLAIAIDGESTGRHTQEYLQEYYRLVARVNQYVLIELRKILS